jgi:hypothetical protein
MVQSVAVTSLMLRLKFSDRRTPQRVKWPWGEQAYGPRGDDEAKAECQKVDESIRCRFGDDLG